MNKKYDFVPCVSGTAAMNTHSPSTSLSSLSYRCVIDLDVVNHMDNVVDLWLELFDNQKEGKEVGYPCLRG